MIVWHYIGLGLALVAVSIPGYFLISQLPSQEDLKNSLKKYQLSEQDQEIIYAQYLNYIHDEYADKPVIRNDVSIYGSVKIYRENEPLTHAHNFMFGVRNNEFVIFNVLENNALEELPIITQ